MVPYQRQIDVEPAQLSAITRDEEAIHIIGYEVDLKACGDRLDEQEFVCS